MPSRIGFQAGHSIGAQSTHRSAVSREKKRVVTLNGYVEGSYAPSNPSEIW